ncbi:MAG: RagB/SusD family nutrient uptake outer membrane protein [Bacteroidales bacterium]|nr:RagB/SusD family nutrient uptake outer membrane protein [Bacteroidales bacterium]
MKRYIIASFAVLMSFASCSLIEKPASMYEKDTYFASESKARMAVAGAYNSLSTTKHYGQWEMAMPSSDDTYYINGTGSDNTRRDISHYNNTLTSNNTWIASSWTYKYLGIDRCNVAVDGIEHMEGYEDNATLKSLDAQARFLRAFLAFDIIKYWGDAPFTTKFTAGYDAAFKGRVDREVIYDAILEDLGFCADNLPMASATSNPEVPCQGAAHVLAMRVLLQRAGYSLKLDGSFTRPDDATRKKYFDAVLDQWKALQDKGFHGFYDGGYGKLFQDYCGEVLNQKESLWEIAFHPIGATYSENDGFWGTWNGPLVDAPTGTDGEDYDSSKAMGRANAFFRVVPAWKDFFEDTDERRDVMVCSYQLKWNATTKVHDKKEQAYPKNAKNWYPGKWRREWMKPGFYHPNATDVNYCPLRYADAVLMAAEALNETGRTSQAWDLLNSVRTRSGATAITASNYATLMKAPKVYDLPFIDDSDDAGKFRTALYYERAFELAFEGQRKWDLIRWGIIKEAMQLFESNLPSSCDGLYVAGSNFVKGKHELFPIPLSEIQANPDLENKNNPGYE